MEEGGKERGKKGKERERAKDGEKGREKKGGKEGEGGKREREVGYKEMRRSLSPFIVV